MQWGLCTLDCLLGTERLPTIRNEPNTVHERELNEVRQYLQTTSECRRKWLLEYFDPKSVKPGGDPKVCCDVCATSVQAISTSSDFKDSFNESALAFVIYLEDDKRMDNPSISRMISSMM